MELPCTKYIGLDTLYVPGLTSWPPIELECRHNNPGFKHTEAHSLCLINTLQTEGVYIQTIDDKRVLFLNQNALNEPTESSVREEYVGEYDIIVDITDKFTITPSSCRTKTLT